MPPQEELAPPTLILTRPARILAPLLAIIIKPLTTGSHQIHPSPSRRRILPNSLFSSLCRTMKASSRCCGGTEVAHTQLLDMERLRAMKLVKQRQDQCMVLGSPPLR